MDKAKRSKMSVRKAKWAKVSAVPVATVTAENLERLDSWSSDSLGAGDVTPAFWEGSSDVVGDECGVECDSVSVECGPTDSTNSLENDFMSDCVTDCVNVLETEGTMDTTSTVVSEAADAPKKVRRASVSTADFIDAYKLIQEKGGTRRDLADHLGMAYLGVCGRVTALKKLAAENGVNLPELAQDAKGRKAGTTADKLKKLFG